MTQELLPAEQQQNMPAFAQRNTMPGSVNAGSVSIEQERAIAEARGQIQIAQMFPRRVTESRAELMAECECMEFAQVAFYNVPRAGGSVSGPSIRLAEAAATAYGHMIWGHRELSRGEDKSEVEVFAWDMQKNNKRIRQVTVDHYRDTKNGRVKLRDEKDIQDKIANVASKQMRGCILAIVPKSFTEAAVARCRQTLAGGGGVPLKERVNKMVDTFGKLGVTTELLVKHLGHGLDSTTGDELVDLIGIYTAIKGGDKIADHFGTTEQDDPAAKTAEDLAATAKAGAAAAQQRKPRAPKQAESVEPSKPQPEPDSKDQQQDSKPTEEAASDVTESPSDSAVEQTAADAGQEGDVF